MSNNPVTYIKKGHVGNINLNRPETGNAIDLPMVQELAEVCSKINQDGDIYVTVVTGEGHTFCSGLDEHYPVSFPDGLNFSPGPAGAIASIYCPTLAVLNGDAIGTGLELALACDLRIAVDKAKFGLPQISKGSLPADGGTQRLARIVGKGKALELLLSGDTIDADEALQIGLVNRIFSGEALLAEAEALARNIAGKAPLALRYCKEAVHKGLDLTLEQGLRLEADLYFLLHTTEDRTEGVKSFLEKRPPEYKGK
jgi:enoyl-CoA hydratase/carnithine racemase